MGRGSRGGPAGRHNTLNQYVRQTQARHSLTFRTLLMAVYQDLGDDSPFPVDLLSPSYRILRADTWCWMDQANVRPCMLAAYLFSKCSISYERPERVASFNIFCQQTNGQNNPPGGWWTWNMMDYAKAFALLQKRYRIPDDLFRLLQAKCLYSLGCSHPNLLKEYQGLASAAIRLQVLQGR